MEEQVTVQIDRDAVHWARRGEGLPLLVLLHGYGSDEKDLFALVPFLPEGVAVASLPAPLGAPWPMPGRSWYPIQELERRDPATVTAAADAVLRWLDAETADAPSIALLGFSQGASVAIQTMRRDPERISAVVNLSGYASPGDLPNDPGLRERRTPVFWGRGTNDDVIPPELVEHTAQWLPEHAELSGRVYQGLTHSVSEDELADVRRFLERWLEDAQAEG
ncbi:alpha/beta hydrolase [Microbacterium sp. ASV81]|uniref:Alpha/beta hydrolase-fold protein n=1 Tax=Microbacterium capsulatum TaxID=3041921 RepID=A0ABU0XKQ0_9MICO|nr:alpha/beta hydrolase-fold protein [Microbacterium sp. ASV81]MDQ4215676.1 alpha/beta hydrolase-fold protein [Microbacterium sp. ASV81]